MTKGKIDQHQSDLQGLIAAVAAKIRKFKDQRIGESNTKSALIEPLLRALGWDISDPDEVHREFKPTSRDCPVDYALKLMRAPRLFIEPKDLGENLSDRKWVAQMLGYAAVAGVEWCVLTDGDEYRFYKATAPIDAAEKLFCSTKISRDALPEVERVLTLMTKGNLEENSLERFWKAHFVDRRVNIALRTIIDNADSGLVRLLRKEATSLRSKDVVESLRRLDVHVDVPSLFQQPVPQSTSDDGSIGPTKTRRTATDAPSTRSEVSLLDVINAGILRPPVRLFKHYKNQMLEATLHPDGRVEFRGKQFDSCSAAGEAARASVTGQKMNTNGWTFWFYTDNTGKPKLLIEAREALDKGSIHTSAS